MLPFVFYNPVKVIFGRGRLADLPGEMQSLGRKILWIYGRESIHQTGLHERILQLLEGFEVAEIGGVGGPNVAIETVRRAITLARDRHVEAILAVGGGSVIDSAKAVAFGVLAAEDVWSYFLDKKRPQSALPIVAIPTWVGSASETNSGMVLSDEGGVKLGMSGYVLFPRTAIMDPELLASVPVKALQIGAIDAFSHACEYYFNGTEVPYGSLADEWAESILRRLYRLILQSGEEADVPEARDEILWLSGLAHNGLLATNRGRVRFEIHVLAHAIEGICKIQHASAISIALPAWLEWREGLSTPRVKQFCNLVLQLPLDSEVENDRRRAADALRRAFRQAGAPVALSERMSVDEELRRSLSARMVFLAAYNGFSDWNMDSMVRALNGME